MFNKGLALLLSKRFRKWHQFMLWRQHCVLWEQLGPATKSATVSRGLYAQLPKTSKLPVLVMGEHVKMVRTMLPQTLKKPAFQICWICVRAQILCFIKRWVLINKTFKYLQQHIHLSVKRLCEIWPVPLCACSCWRKPPFLEEKKQNFEYQRYVEHTHSIWTQCSCGDLDDVT